MTVKEIKQILGEARAAGLKYIELRNKAREYERRLTDGKAVKYQNDGCVYERDGNSVERGMCVAADYSAEADRAKQALSVPYIKAGRLIYLVGDDKQRDVLNRRYLRCQSWGQIAREMKISRQWACKLHGFGLKNISDKFSKNT